MISHKQGTAASYGSRMQHWLWLGPLFYMILVGLYFPGRYDGNWAETDSATFTRTIRDFASQESLVPDFGAPYPNGYAFQVISDYVLSLTGLELVQLQQWVYPLLAALVVLPAWLLYRELTGSDRGAVLATLLLFTQPEFLFVVLRSSHEKFSRALMLLCLYWLIRSFDFDRQPRNKALYLSLFCLTMFAFISSNNLLAYSLIFALAVVLLVGWSLGKRNPALGEFREILKPLPFLIVISLVLVYLFVFHIYPPAQHDLEVVGSTWKNIVELFTGVETQPTNSYTQVSQAWLNVPTYFLLSIANWIMLAASFLIWLRQGWGWFMRSESPNSRTAWFLWLLYAAFAFQGAFSVISDASGSLGSNLQHRIFASFSMISIAVVGSALADWRTHHSPRLVSLGLGAGIFCISILSVMKATNEPLVSNKWTFYRPAELLALEWSDANLENAEIWTEFDERLIAAYVTVNDDPNNRFITFVSPGTRNMLLTTISRFRSTRINQPIPVPPDALRVYDNGFAQLYHLRPQSPYQR